MACNGVYVYRQGATFAMWTMLDERQAPIDVVQNHLSPQGVSDVFM
jgi:hypothetical protein